MNDMSRATIRRTTKTVNHRRRTVTFIFEGERTEEIVVNSLFNPRDYSNLKFTPVVCMNGGGYSNIRFWIEKNRDICDVIIVIADLDRAAKQAAERKNLKALVAVLERTDNANNIFLTYKNLEDWLIRYFVPVPKKGIYEYINSGKSDKHMMERIDKKGGTLEHAVAYYKDRPLFYEKKTLKKGFLTENHVDKNQSGLFYLRQYLGLLNREG